MNSQFSAKLFIEDFKNKEIEGSSLIITTNSNQSHLVIKTRQ